MRSRPTLRRALGLWVAVSVALLAVAPGAVRGEPTLSLITGLGQDRLGPFRLGMTQAELDAACRSIGTIHAAHRGALGIDYRCRASSYEEYGARLRDHVHASVLHRSEGGPSLRARYRELERALKDRYGDPIEASHPIESLTWRPTRDRFIELDFIPRTASQWGQAIRIVVGTGAGWP